jgi:hypothetical protein
MNGSLLLLLWLLLLMAAVVRVPLLAFVQFHHGRILVAGFVGAGAVVEAVTDEDSANVVVENGSSAPVELPLLLSLPWPVKKQHCGHCCSGQAVPSPDGQ